jgi:RNA polymerase sigma factor (sigma-70 family)
MAIVPAEISCQASGTSACRGGPEMTSRELDGDAELLRRWSDGEKSAGGELFKRHAPALYRFLRKRFGNDGEDLGQQAFLACFEAAGRFRGESNLRSYLVSIARYQGLAHCRRLMRGNEIEASLSAWHEDVSDLDELRMRETLVLALEKLPTHMREVLDLYYWCELPQPEVARALGIPVGTVASRLRSAKEKLRGLLTQDACLLDGKYASLESDCDHCENSYRASDRPARIGH